MSFVVHPQHSHNHLTLLQYRRQLTMFARFSLFGRGTTLQIAITLACSMAFILFGYDQGVFGGIVINENWKETFGHPGSGLEGIIVSIYNLGAFSGCVLSFFTGERLGRRVSMWFAMAWIVSSAPGVPSLFAILTWLPRSLAPSYRPPLTLFRIS
jgi:MFS family permease